MVQCKSEAPDSMRRRALDYVVGFMWQRREQYLVRPPYFFEHHSGYSPCSDHNSRRCVSQ